MLLSELKAILDRRAELDRDDLEVVIESAQGGIPTRRMIPVARAGAGFDWTARLFVLHPEKSVVVAKILDAPLEQAALKRLAALKDGFARSGQKYIAKAREREWLDGFMEGVLAHVTSCGSG